MAGLFDDDVSAQPARTATTNTTTTPPLFPPTPNTVPTNTATSSSSYLNAHNPTSAPLTHSLTKVAMLQGQKMVLHDMQLRENLIVYNMIVQRYLPFLFLLFTLPWFSFRYTRTKPTPTHTQFSSNPQHTHKRCFYDCVNSFHTLHMSNDERTCIKRCADKHIHHSERVGRKFSDAAGAQFLNQQQQSREAIIRANKEMDNLKDKDLL